MGSSDEIRKRLLDGYYSNVYQPFLFSGGGAQVKGIVYFESQVEKFWLNPEPRNVLEIGGGSGEHLPFISYVPSESYVSLDLRSMVTKEHLKNLKGEFQSKLSFVEGNAEALPFKDASFDRVFTTCLLHHVDDVLGVLLEARRVTEIGGEIAFLIPTDPGILNQMVKKLFSFRKMKKLTKIRPQLFYALDHKNHIGSIIKQIEFVFQDDLSTLHYRPFY